MMSTLAPSRLWGFWDVKNGVAHLRIGGFSACGLRNRAWHEWHYEDDIGAIDDDKKCKKCKAKDKETK